MRQRDFILPFDSDKLFGCNALIFATGWRHNKKNL